MDDLQWIRQQVVLAGGGAVLFEVELRMLCEKHDATQKRAYQDLDKDVLPAILEHFGVQISESERKLLEDALALRNELVHARFERVNRLLETRFGADQGARVVHAKVPVSAPDLLREIV